MRSQDEYLRFDLEAASKVGGLGQSREHGAHPFQPCPARPHPTNPLARAPDPWQVVVVDAATAKRCTKTILEEHNIAADMSKARAGGGGTCRGEARGGTRRAGRVGPTLARMGCGTGSECSGPPAGLPAPCRT